MTIIASEYLLMDLPLLIKGCEETKVCNSHSKLETTRKIKKMCLGQVYIIESGRLS